jgi:hypothetical protein
MIALFLLLVIVAIALGIVGRLAVIAELPAMESARRRTR